MTSTSSGTECIPVSCHMSAVSPASEEDHSPVIIPMLIFLFRDPFMPKLSRISLLADLTATSERLFPPLVVSGGHPVPEEKQFHFFRDVDRRPSVVRLTGIPQVEK